MESSVLRKAPTIASQGCLWPNFTILSALLEGLGGGGGRRAGGVFLEELPNFYRLKI